MRYYQHMIRKSEVTKALDASSLPGVKSLWHGTDADSLMKICQDKFDRVYAGKNGKSHNNSVTFYDESLMC